MKTTLLSIALATVVLFLVSGLFYQIIFASVFAEGVRPFASLSNTQPNLLLILVNHGIAAFFITVIFNAYNVNSYLRALRVGVGAGLLLSLYVELWFLVSFNCLSSSYVIATLTAAAVQMALASVAIVWLRKRLVSNSH